jgi:hypothetical protein
LHAEYEHPIINTCMGSAAFIMSMATL